MKPTLVFFILSFSMFITSTRSEKDYITAFVIKIAIDTALNQVKKTGHLVVIRDLSLKIPRIFNEIIIGRLGVKNFTIYGLSTLKYTDRVNVDKEKENNITVKTYNVNINAMFNKLGLYTTYDADLNIANTLPIYGKGEIQLGVTDVDIKVNVTLNDRKRLNIQELELQLSFRSSNESKITGFWNNIGVSRVVTKSLNILERFIAMYYCYFKKCFECIISRITRIVINIILTGQKEKYNRCSCSQKNLLIDKLEDILESWSTGNLIRVTNGELADPATIKKYLKLFIHMLDTILGYEDKVLKYKDDLQKLI